MSITPKNKLVRNNVPDSISEQGRTPNTRTLNDTEFEKEIFNKLLDEVKEVVEAKDDQQHLTEELADVQEVIDSIIKIKNLDLKQIQQIQKNKRDQWGGFDQKTWLTSVTEKE